MSYHENAYSALWEQRVNTSDELLDFADTVLVSVDEIEPDDLLDRYVDDRIMEIADSSVPIYTHELMEVVSSDCGLLVEGPSDPGILSDDPNVVEIAQATLYDLAYQIASTYLAERQEWEEEVREAHEEAIEEYEEIVLPAREIVADAAEAWHEENARVDLLMRLIGASESSARRWIRYGR